MAKTQKNGGPNKSAAIREIFKQNPDIKVKEVVTALAAKGLSVAPNLVYLVKGKAKGEQSHRRKVNKTAAGVAIAAGNVDFVKTIVKVKALAHDVGGLDTLKALVDALSA